MLMIYVLPHEILLGIYLFLGFQDAARLWLALANPLEVQRIYKYLHLTPSRENQLEKMRNSDVNGEAILSMWQALYDLLTQSVVSARITFDIIDAKAIIVPHGTAPKLFKSQPVWGPLRMRQSKKPTNLYLLRVTVSVINGRCVVLQTERFCQKTLQGKTVPHEVVHLWVQHFFAGVRVAKKKCPYHLWSRWLVMFLIPGSSKNYWKHFWGEWLVSANIR